VEESEFISDGGEGEVLPRRIKRRRATFCEIINLTDSQKSVNRPSAGKRRPEVGAEPSEFISDGGGGNFLPRRVKRRRATFYEIINFEQQDVGNAQKKRSAGKKDFA